MPKGNKKAGYIGLMLAKANGKKHTDYDPVVKKKKSGAFNPNRVRNPSDYIKLACVNTYKPPYKAPNALPANATWQQVLSSHHGNKQNAIASYVKLYPNKSERTIAKETGVSQPSVNRWKRLAGGAGEDEHPLTDSDILQYNSLMKENPPTVTEMNLANMRIANDEDLNTAKKVGEETLGKIFKKESDPDTEATVDEIDETVRADLGNLVAILESWEEERNELYDTIIEQEEEREDMKDEMGFDATESNNENPLQLDEEYEPQNRQEALIEDLRYNKQQYFVTLQIIKQIKQAIIKVASQLEPSSEPKEYKAFNLKKFNPKNYVQWSQSVGDVIWRIS
jgi:hypothetical protein